ncbi:MAG TPA: hypothetical protein VFV50_19580 [Bdellovibrionales bacterium]|nr:hypothetical protein [Bdellovibrionales bacterium]
MKPVLVIAALLISAQASAQTQYAACREAFTDAVKLAFFGTYYNQSIVADIDRIDEVNSSINQNVQNLGYIAQSAGNFVDIAGNIGTTLDQGMVPNVQEAYNNAYNTAAVLKAAQGLNDVDALKAHVNEALRNVQRSMMFAQKAEQHANGVKAKAQQIESQAKQTSQKIAQAVQAQRDNLARASRAIQRTTYELVGQNYWGNKQPAYNSKLGILKSTMEYMDRNQCVKAGK